ncbi:hypothetical protein CCR75_003809 [Bremia lactucae]|uniref:HTH CENPB-type domain-containing protein n=1 Tax=Bremia lactucae TaxID=4779 RepID=A0A976FJR2_BRELC|nr:hypothetical protein CCR75_003809 [Bremia lactucae]
MAKSAPDSTNNPQTDVPRVPRSEAVTASSLPPEAKRKKVARTALTLREKAIVKSFCEQKLTVCKARGEPLPSQETLRQEVALQFGMSCGRSTLSKIIAMDWKLLRGSHEGGEAPRNSNMKRRRRPLFPAFEADLLNFILAHVDESHESAFGSDIVISIDNTKTVSTEEDTLSRSEHKRPLSEALILEEAQRLKQVHSISNEMLVLSVGWLARFKHRHCIRLRKPGRVANKSTTLFPQQANSHGLINSWPPGLLSAPMLPSMDPLISQDPLIMTPEGEHEVSLPTSSQQSNSVEPIADRKCSFVSIERPLCSAQWIRETLSKYSSKTDALLQQIPQTIRELAYPCQEYDGIIEAIGGLKVAVLGRGSVVDAFLLAKAVGPRGSVTCVEVNSSNVYIAEQMAEDICLGTLGLPGVNLKIYQVGNDDTHDALSSVESDEFKSFCGQIDVVVCNWSMQASDSPVSNDVMLTMASSLLKIGGELRVTTWVNSRRLSMSECEKIRLKMNTRQESGNATSTLEKTRHSQQDLLLNAPYVGDMQRLFWPLSEDVEVRLQSCSNEIAAAIDGALDSLISSLTWACDIKLRRMTFRVFRLEEIEKPPEYYGQSAIFHGFDDEEDLKTFQLDDAWHFQKGVRLSIDGNTAQILQTTWMQKYFTVTGNRSTHYGSFASKALPL